MQQRQHLAQTKQFKTNSINLVTSEGEVDEQRNRKGDREDDRERETVHKVV